jgi:hypothetical protein
MRTLGEDAPGFQVGEAVLDRGAFGADQLVDLLVGGGEGLVAGGFAAGDDDRVVGIGVQADEAEVGQGAPARVPQLLDEPVMAGGGDLG